ncbi:MAG: ABC transporter substrate-binding protein, partial [Burkholderiales bacterium]|nr:ABC transporter substrate-binding protein [Burkholderiales bacterium]
RWCNKDFDKLVNDAVKTTDKAARTDMYMKAQEIFKRELPWTTMAHSVVTVFTTPNVTDYKISPFGAVVFQGVDLK